MPAEIFLALRGRAREAFVGIPPIGTFLCIGINGSLEAENREGERNTPVLGYESYLGLDCIVGK